MTNKRKKGPPLTRAVAVLTAALLGGQLPACVWATAPRARMWTPAMGGPSAGDEYVNPADGSVLVWVQGGRFAMGSKNGPSDEAPVHQVQVRGLWMGKFEVTNKQYNKFLKATAYGRTPMFWNDENYGRPDQPVVGVTFHEAQEYCKWAGARLPTEAEWEYAAAGGKQLQYPTTTGQLGHDSANIRGVKGRDRWRFTAPVGRFSANPFGLHDMAGNAWEWTSTRFAKYPYSATDGRENKDTYGLRVLRGGCWKFPDDYCRTTQRHRFASHLRYDYAGIRIAITDVTAKE